MNIEAAKAMRYGGLSREEALALVTINPARQLGVADRIGSLEPGKDADFVLWSGDPLSGYSRPLETWVDGARRFSVAEDQALRERDSQRRAALAQKALGYNGNGNGNGNHDSNGSGRR